MILFYLTEPFCIFAVNPRLYIVYCSVFLYSWFYFSDLIKEQMERKDRLSHELVRHKERLHMMQKDVHTMETDLKSRLGAPTSFVMVNTNQFRICGIILFLQLFQKGIILKSESFLIKVYQVMFRINCTLLLYHLCNIFTW